MLKLGKLRLSPFLFAGGFLVILAQLNHFLVEGMDLHLRLFLAPASILVKPDELSEIPVNLRFRRCNFPFKIGKRLPIVVQVLSQERALVSIL